MSALAQPVSAQFLPLTLAPLEAAIVGQPFRTVPTLVAKPTSLRQPAQVLGIIEIKFDGATVHINGLPNLVSQLRYHQSDQLFLEPAASNAAVFLIRDCRDR